jgi:hypothetical protein
MLPTPATCQRVNARTKPPNIDVNQTRLTAHLITRHRGPTANSPLHVPPDSRIQSSLAVRSRPNHGANSVPPWHCQEDRESAFEPADEQECRYTGTSDGIPENRPGTGSPCKSRKLTRNTDLPQLCVVYARVRTDHLTLFHYANATRHASLALRYAM